MWPSCAILLSVHAAADEAAEHPCNIDKRDGRKLSLSEFRRKYAEPRRPVVLTNLWKVDLSSDFIGSARRLTNEFTLAPHVRQFEEYIRLSIRPESTEGS